MAAQHTPGPWNYFEDGDANHYHLLDNDGGWVMALLHNGEALPLKQRANLRLAATAPELLDSLKEFVQWARDCTSPTEPNSPHYILVRAVEAIAKATGETA